jgi:hypothetical protein
LPPKYIFLAGYKDGFVYRQSADDASQQEPGQNAFYDIRYKPIRPESELVTFGLFGPAMAAVVNLTDGSFFVNGQSFRMTPGPVAGCKLFFGKRGVQGLVDGQQVQLTTYRLGWEAGEQSRILEIE